MTDHDAGCSYNKCKIMTDHDAGCRYNICKIITDHDAGGECASFASSITPTHGPGPALLCLQPPSTARTPALTGKHGAPATVGEKRSPIQIRRPLAPEHALQDFHSRPLLVGRGRWRPLHVLVVLALIPVAVQLSGFARPGDPLLAG